MNISKRGIFYGETNKTLLLDGLTLTDTEYTKPYVDWHYHENAYFTFILQGNVIESNKKETYNCSAGSLLYHNWQEPHYNIKPDGFTRGFHVEIEHEWSKRSGLESAALQGSLNISHPGIKLLMYKIFMESKTGDGLAGLSVPSLLAELLAQLGKTQKSNSAHKPEWVGKINELLHDRWADSHTLDELAKIAGVHPVHLSRDFSKYFQSNIAEYIRKIRISKALSLMSRPELTLTEIAHDCGFFDQSHFIRCFRQINGMQPSQHRKILLAV